jgi:catechol 2,3-dioxygenase-like lactoylglutathione lyase family enzyme
MLPIMTQSFALEESGLARLSHVSLQVRDLERALDFYREIFGFQIVLEKNLEGPEFEAVTDTPGARSKLVRGLVAGNSVVQLFWHNWREPQEEKRTLMSFEVRDAYAAHAALCAAGVTCQSGPVPFDNSHAFVLHDPDGHPIEIIQWTPDASPYRVRTPIQDRASGDSRGSDS